VENRSHTEFLRLYEPIHLQLSKFCRAMSGNTEDAKDLLNDTILNILESFDNIKDKAVFKSYIFSVASNLYKKKIRRLKFNAEFNANELNQITDLSQNPEYVTDFKIIYQQILMLPGKMAETLILYHISDLSMEEIQKIQGGSLSGVKQRLIRGREKLLSRLESKEQVRIALLFLTL
jgi:RNA polymerase sigma-70 factor, ECF subfamily